MSDSYFDHRIDHMDTDFCDEISYLVRRSSHYELFNEAHWEAMNKNVLDLNFSLHNVLIADEITIVDFDGETDV